MQRTATATIILFVFLILICGGAICLQIWLSKKRSPWPGLIIPIFFFLYSLISVLSVPAYFSGVSVVEVRDERGTVIEQYEEAGGERRPGALETAALIIPTFLTANIPTIILMAVYFSGRKKRMVQNELDKMNVQDLE